MQSLPDPKNPIATFRKWFEEARAKGLPAPDAMTLATASPRGIPSARVVLLKEVGPKGFVFYTNYRSRKAAELKKNPRAALVFLWEPLGRQVRVEGRVSLASKAESDRYWHSRDRGSQIGAWASDQSHEIAGRDELMARKEAFERKFEGKPVPRPPHWGGFRVAPERIELWISGAHRLHDRFAYVKAGSRWKVTRLSP